VKAPRRGARFAGMADDPMKEPGAAARGEGQADDEDSGAKERVDRGLSDFVRRAVAAGMEAAGRSKEDIVRVASSEIRNWLDHLELDTELRKALSKMVLEVKAEIRFRPTEDGKLVPETEADVKVRGPGKG
jgi:hypothetical protein